jgi:NAD(P)-dependent dehydrogenase (short-subunit alcohol dehydrogenase family)
MSDFPNGAAIVFGATGGIGRVVCLELAKAGSDVAITWHSNEAVAKDLAKEIESLGRKASVHQCDVLNEGASKAVIEAAALRHGRLHTMVWGAGPLVEQVYVADTRREQWQNAVNVEVHGFFDAAQSAITHMREQGGSIIHLGSAGHLSWPDKDVLSVAPKAANESLIKAIAREEGKNLIRANSVLIGVIEAGMFLELSKQGVFDEAWTADVQKNLALKRWGQPEEVGHAVVFLASEKAAYVTGQQIAVAGGYGL